MRRVTVRDIAQAVGCSQSTVSLALNGRPGVAAATTQRVVAAADELGYRPNLIARRLFAQETGTIGVLFHDLSGFFMAQNLRGINEVAAARGYTVILSISERRLGRECEMLDLFMAEQVDGIVLCTTARLGEGEHLDQLKRRQIPFVLIDRYLAHVETDFVVSDNDAGGYQLLSHVLDAGHRRVGILVTDESISSVRDRMSGCTRALDDHGILDEDRLVRKVSIFSDQGITRNMASLYRALDELMKGGAPPSALVTMSSDLTPGALGWLTHHGIRVPEDVTLAAFDQIPLLSSLGIQVTTVAQEPFEMGSGATRLLLDRISGKERGHGQVKIATNLIESGEGGMEWLDMTTVAAGASRSQ
jgi:LacI family transcriptional regulator